MRSAPAGGAGFATGFGPTVLLGVLVADRLAHEGLIPHKDLWPLSARDVVGLVLAALSLLVAAGGGIGGCCLHCAVRCSCTVGIPAHAPWSYLPVDEGRLAK